MRFLSKYAALLNSEAFFMLIQPMFSHVFRCTVSPLIAYFESDSINRGRKGGVASVAFMIAAISAA